MNLLTIDEYRALGTEPRFHGMGFIQLPLGRKGCRLHVFGADGFDPIIGDGVIHDHTWRLRSNVVHGELVHATFDFTVNSGGPHSLWPCAHKIIKGYGGARHHWHGVRGEAVKTGWHRMPAGSYYELEPGRLHTIRTEMLCITVMDKVEVLGAPTWPSAVAVGEGPPDDAYPVEPPHSVSRLWEGIEAALAEAEKQTE